MKVIVCKDYEEASEKAAEIVIALVKNRKQFWDFQQGLHL